MRREFTNKLIAWKNSKQRKPLIVKGVRQCGKTYSISEFGRQYFPKMHYVNFEKDGRFAKIFQPDLNPIRIVNELSFVLDSPIDINTDLIFFDEIQDCPRAIFKLYLADVGLLGALSQLPAKTILEYDYGTYKGYFAENFVAQEFLSSGVDQLYSWQSNHAEVEFLRDIDGEVIPIEVKSGHVTRAKSLQIFATKYHAVYRVILSGKPLQIDHTNNIHHYPLYLAGWLPLPS